jgi:hypothetical protein
MWYHSQQVREIVSSAKYVCNGSGAHPASHPWVMGTVSPGGQSILGVKLTDYIHLVPRLTMSGVMRLLPNMPLWHAQGHLCLISDIISNNKVRFLYSYVIFV